MSGQDRLQLVFHPGLSAAEIITDSSGRGVGMDVVKTVVERDLKGSVTISTIAGAGTTTIMRLPLSLASSRLFILDCAGRTFAIPLSAVQTSLQANASSCMDVAGRRAIRHENQFIPLAELASLLSLPRRHEATSSMLLLLASGAERLALGVDEIVDEQEMLIRPLPTLIEGLRHVSGVTFGASGDPIPVLDVPDLIEQSRHESVPREQAPSLDSERPHYRILVVDDSYNTREVQRHILESHDYIVTLAGDGIEALERLSHDEVDLVVTDIEMPRMDGFTLVERIRADERLRRLPIIILSSRESEGDRARGVDVGANAYIVKRTFDEQKLTATLETLLP